jgi:hypothetical protein
VFRREVHTIAYVCAQVAMEGVAIALKKSLKGTRPTGSTTCVRWTGAQSDATQRTL